MNYLPIFIDLRGRECLVVGGGPVAFRRAELLTRAGARVRVVAQAVCGALRELIESAGLALRVGAYREGDLDGVTLVIAATDNPEVNARVAADAGARSLPVNVVDHPALCSFIMPAIVDRDPVLIAISTAGASPVLARMTRARIESVLPEGIGKLAAFAARHRARVKDAIADSGMRRRLWESLLDGSVGASVMAGRESEAEQALADALERPAAVALGRVAILATADGDPDRLTLGALRWLGHATVVYCEPGVSHAVLAYARRDAERVALRNGIAPELAAIVDRVRRGETICLLHRGDPPTPSSDAWQRGLEEAGLRPVALHTGPR